MAEKRKRDDEASTLQAATAAILPEMIEIRHEIHADPEPGFQETRTHARIEKYLSSLGLDGFRTMGGTGIVVDIEGTGDLPLPATGVRCIALRADMDALVMVEAQNDLKYRSKNEGVAHMCGHDGHMASLLGTATLIYNARSKIPKGAKVRLLFQPAEEGPGGALPMINDGCLEGVDEVYGYHNWPAVQLGTMAVTAGALMASVSDFYITIIGKGGHASTPHICIDPIIAASHVVTALQTIVSRSISSQTNAVVTVAYFHAGTTNNVIPERAELKGTIRHLSPDVDQVITTRMRQIVKSTAEAYGCTAEINIVPTYPVLMNHTTETNHVIRVGKAVLGEQNVTAADLPKMGAEDFAYYLQHRPGCFYFLGGAEPSRNNAICHSTQFDFNDHILPISFALYIRLVEDRFAIQLYD